MANAAGAARDGGEDGTQPGVGSGMVGEGALEMEQVVAEARERGRNLEGVRSSRC